MSYRYNQRHNAGLCQCTTPNEPVGVSVVAGITRLIQATQIDSRQLMKPNVSRSSGTYYVLSHDLNLLHNRDMCSYEVIVLFFFLLILVIGYFDKSNYKIIKREIVFFFFFFAMLFFAIYFI